MQILPHSGRTPRLAGLPCQAPRHLTFQSHLIPWTLRQAGSFHLWNQPLHSKFTLFWSRPGLEAEQLVGISLLSSLAWVTLPRGVSLLSLVETDDGAHDSSCEGTQDFHIGWLFYNKKRRQLEIQTASCQHFTFCLSPREASTEPLVEMVVVALPTEPGEVAQPGSRLGAVGSGLYL